MSEQWDQALAEFVQNIGIKNFNATPGSLAVSNLIIEDGRYILDIEKLDEPRGVVMALFSKVAAHELYDKAKLLLSYCHYDKFLPFLVQPGLRGDDTLVLMVHLEEAWAENLVRAFDLMHTIYTESKI